MGLVYISQTVSTNMSALIRNKAHAQINSGCMPYFNDLVEALDTGIRSAMPRLDIPGVAIGICDASQTLWSAGYGVTAKHGGFPITPATRFSVQSTSKLFTATTVLLAAQQSLVELDEPIATYIPEFKVNSLFDDDPGALITLRHLLSHTAGFTHEAPLGSNYDLGDGDFDAHCRSIFDTWLRFPVGHHFEYSNLGIDLAGYVLERVSGVKFAQYAERELFEPLQLGRTTFDPAVIEADTNRAVGNWRPFDHICRALPVAVPMVAAGGLYTTADDALRFIRLYLRMGDSFLAPTSVAEQYRVPFALAEQNLGYGLGVYVDEWLPGVRIYHHGGSGFGFQNQLFWFGDLQLGAVILTNSFDHSLQNELAHQIVEHVCASQLASSEQPTRDPAIPLTTPTSADGNDVGGIEDCLGEYVGRLDDRFEVRVDAGRLLVQDGVPYQARVVGPRTIELDNPVKERFRFDTGPGGTVAYMVAVRDGQTRYRNEPAPMPGPGLDPASEGTYNAVVWGVPMGRYRLAQDGESPVIEKLADAYGSEDEPVTSLFLTAIEPGLYMSSMGEVLDLRSATPTYANIPLVKENPPPEVK
jgi:CubicO group peptidase (beta-lactamase class C family)